MEPPALTDDCPDPHAAFVLLRVFIEAHIEMGSRRKGERFLRKVAEKLADEESLATVLMLRPTRDAAAVRRARRQAARLFSVYMPRLLGRLPDK